MKGVIYCYHCISNGKKYIGQTINEKQRKRQHINLCKKGIDHKFYRAVKKYGWDNFVYGIIDEYDDAILNEQEIFYIIKYNTYENGYNSTFGGGGIRGCDYCRDGWRGDLSPKDGEAWASSYMDVPFWSFDGGNLFPSEASERGATF